MSKYDIDVDEVRHLYVNDLEDVRDIAGKYGCSVPNVRRILKKHGIRRGKAAISAGKTYVPNRGKRDPDAKRNRPKAKFRSEEHREKLAAAKLGRFGPQANNWRGGVSKIGHSLYMERRRTVDGRRMYEHRYVAEQCLGRRLLRHEHVHHIDRDRTNNAPANLIVLRSMDHNLLHRAIDAGATCKASQIAWLNESGIHYEVCYG